MYGGVFNLIAMNYQDLAIISVPQPFFYRRFARHTDFESSNKAVIWKREEEENKKKEAELALLLKNDDELEQERQALENLQLAQN